MLNTSAITNTNYDKEAEAARLRGSLLAFTQFFYECTTGRPFMVSAPLRRESHHITTCRTLTQAARLEVLRAVINLPPGSGKSTMVCMWVAWCMAQYPDSNFLYISYSHDLAAKHTAFIKSIIGNRLYGYLFGVAIDKDSRAKDSFRTLQGGTVKAFGSAGAITGQDAGLPGLDRFSGAVILDDAHKPDEAHSDAMRQRVIDNYQETIRQRPRGQNVPIIYIGQRVHEDDLTAFFLGGRDVDVWTPVILKGLDDAGNALYPEVMTADKLLALQDKSPYVFASQYQQDPLPAGGALFKPEWFVQLDNEPPMLCTFITADTAETQSTYNDASVFSFWGLYEIETFGRKTGDYGLHWIDCVELRVEPKDLRSEFLDFYANCMKYPTPPKLAAIEKKSTGITLVSVLQEIRGLQIRPIERTAASRSKSDRFLDMQPYVATKLISLPSRGYHTEMCLAHMRKITANNTHRHDDIADTLYDAVKLALIDKSIYTLGAHDNPQQHKLDVLSATMRRRLDAGARLHGKISP